MTTIEPLELGLEPDASTFPPTLRLGDTDRAKYVGIGESDRMTLKFVKIAKP